MKNNSLVLSLLDNINDIEKPARYIGNELGIPKKDWDNSDIKVVLSYPDIYEIGMSNNGIKILYDRINRLSFACCERVFSPWSDFESKLLNQNIPLFSLESKKYIKDFDILGVSIQYELLFSNFLNILKLSNINIFRTDRKESDPIVILGGPAVSNPAPYTNFADLIYIGEGEDGFVEIVTKYRELKKKNLNRSKIIQELSEIEGVYSPEFSTKKVKRRIYMNFSTDKGPDIFIRPNINIVQNKLVVEIMRGCPNRCRFCQAGVVYKPHREKDINLIMESVKNGVKKTGVDEVTFASLSSGDYTNLLELVDIFNSNYKKQGISFSLPSLKVETFDINILEKISEVRKSGLTFAIETGSIDGQKKLGKIVDTDKIVSIIDEAQKKGWSLIKFYFMIGLPDIEDEENQIIQFIDSLLTKYRKLKINLNIATYVPKAHTPFQFEKQISLEQSINKINYIKTYYKKSRVVVKEHSPYMSYIEGFIARGNSDVGLVVYEAFLNGAKFDGWNEKFNYELYKNALSKYNFDISIINEFNTNNYPWKVVDSRVGQKFLEKENIKSKKSELTDSCKGYCDCDCEVCNDKIQVVDSKKVDNKLNENTLENEKINKKDEKFRYILEFTKYGLYKYLSHIDLIRYFEYLFRISDIDINLTEGFNPHPRFQFSSALSMGVESSCEILEFYTNKLYDNNLLIDLLNNKSNSLIIINKVNNVKKVKFSLYDQIYFYHYIYFFENLNYNFIERRLKDIENGLIYYEDNKQFIVKDFFRVLQLEENCLKVEITKLKSNPSLNYLLKDIFENKIIRILKNSILTCEKMKLYDWILNYES